MIHLNQTLVASAYGAYRANYLAAFIRGELEAYTLQESIIIGISRNKDAAPRSNIPFVFLPDEEANTQNKTIVLCDGTGIRDLEADLRFVNLILTSMWEDPIIHERFSAIRKFAAKAYITWFGRSLMNRYNLNWSDKIEVDILAAIYYYSADGVPSDHFGPDNFTAMRQIAEIVNVPTSRVADVIADRSFGDTNSTFTFKDLIDCIGEVSTDLKSKVSVTSVTAVLANSWYGEGGKFYCNLAVEYPPMFMTLLYFALVSTDFKRTNLANLVKEFAVGRQVNQGEMYVKQLNTYVRGMNATRTL